MGVYSLPNSPASIVRQLLVDLAVGIDPNTDESISWQIFDTAKPNQPDNIIVVRNIHPRLGGTFQTSGEIETYPHIQIEVRSAYFDIGWSKVEELREELDTGILNNSVTIGSNLYLVQCVRRSSGPVSLGKEKPLSNRNLFTLNASVTVTKVE